jgi:hypothetical protein
VKPNYIKLQHTFVTLPLLLQLGGHIHADATMSDSRLVVSALLAYAQAASQEVGNKGYEVGTIQDALSSQVLDRMLGVR